MAIVPGEVDALLDKAKEVLGPLGAEHVERVVSWLRREALTRPLVDTCSHDPPLAGDDGNLAYWRLGEESPSTAGQRIFAMFLWEPQRAVVAYSFSATAVDGGTQINFRREVIFKPDMVSGPIYHEALYEDLRGFVVVEDDVDTAVRVLRDNAKIAGPHSATFEGAAKTLLELNDVDDVEEKTA